MKTLTIFALVVFIATAVALLGQIKTYPVHETGGILVTGASSGIGRHAALHLAKHHGYTVYAGVRKEKDAQSIRDEGVKSLKPVILDVTKEDDVNTAVRFITDDLSKNGQHLVAVVNNAGMPCTAPVELMDLSRAKFCFDVNYFGVVRVTKAFLPLLRSAGPGSRLVHVSSVAGLVSSPFGTPYSSTKFALEALNDALRTELAPWQISSSSINPAFVSTKIFGKSKSERKSQTSTEGISVEERELYAHYFSSKHEKQMDEMTTKADSPIVTTEAIAHAITSPNPKVRYVVANVDGTPAWIFIKMKWLLPERIYDMIVLKVMDM